MMFSKNFKPVRFLFAILCGLLISFTAFAQGDRGILTGRLSDSRGAVVPQAVLTLNNEGTNISIDATSNSDGEFTFPGLAAGTYTLSVKAAGFKPYAQEHIQVDVGLTRTVDVSLAVGSVSEAVTVYAAAQQVNTDNPNLGMTIEEKSMTDLPLIYGNPFALAYLAPGVTLSGVNPNLHVYDSGTAAVSVNGSVLNAIDYKLDGAPDNRLRVTAFTPNTESISQYRMSTANYDATNGHASGGYVNVQTKSGTEQLHGSLFGYYQNPNINANVWLVNPLTTPQVKPEFERFGGAIGGPIWRSKKLYFFTGVEHSLQVSPSVSSAQVPTAAEIAGNFQSLLALDTTAHNQTCGSSPTTLTASTNAPINKYQLFDPRSVVYNSATNTYSRLCIPNNNVAAYTTLSPIAQAVLKYYPAAQTQANGIGTYNYDIASGDHYLGGIARFDYALSTRQSMYVHLERSKRYNTSSLYFPPVSGTNLAYQNWGFAFGHAIAISPTLAITSTFGYTRFTNNNYNTAQGSVTPTSIGMNSNLTAGLPAFAQALPSFSLSGYTTLNTSSYTLGLDDIWLGNTTASKQWKSHFLRFGMEYRRYLTNGEPGSNENGSYSTSGSLMTATSGTSLAVTGPASIAQFEFGLINSGNQTQNSDYASRSDYYALFLQDDWRVTNRLTINMGMRWDHELPLYERNGKEIVSFNYNATNSTTVAGASNYLAKDVGKSALLPATINPVGGPIYANTNGFGHYPYQSPNLNFDPRVGIVFAIDPKTVVRAGFGIFFDSIQSQYISGMNTSGNPIIPQTGYSQVTNVTGPTYANGVLTLAGTLANPFPSGLLALTGNSLGLNSVLGQDVQYVEPKPHMPYNERFNLGLQRQFGQFLLSLDYVGNHGVHQPTQQLSMGTNYGGEDFNAIPNSYLSTVTNGLDNLENYNMSGVSVANPFSGLEPSGSTNNLSSANFGVAQLLRPRPEYGRINAYEFNGMSIYHSAQFMAQRRFTSGLSTTVAFTWSHSLDGLYYLNPGDARPWYGVSMNDRPLRLSTSGIYQLPFGYGRHWLSTSRGLLAQIVGGWQIQGVYQVQSGQPINFTASSYVYYGTNPGDSHWSRSSYKATIVPGSGLGGRWFNTTNWLTSQAAVASNYHTVSCPAYNPTTPTVNTFCSLAFPNTYQIRAFAPRFNTLRADRLNQIDLGLQRQFQLEKLGTLQFRVEAINALNHPVYSAPTSTDPTNASFAQITSQANQPRVYQFAAFYRF